jgi:hypothetical protein
VRRWAAALAVAVLAVVATAASFGAPSGLTERSPDRMVSAPAGPVVAAAHGRGTPDGPVAVVPAALTPVDLAATPAATTDLPAAAPGARADRRSRAPPAGARPV